MTRLDEILDHKRREVDAAKQRVTPAAMAERAACRLDAPRGLRAALVSGEKPRVIAEVKRRSPSRGEIRPNFDPVSCAADYAAAGAAAISMLTDEEYFGGRLEYLVKAREVISLPVLRKDFTIDAYQIDESHAAGADAVLLIVAAFPGAAGRDRMAALYERARSLGMDALVEVHDEVELAIARDLGADLVGINNRNLKTFEVDLATTERLAAAVFEGVVLVAESGIFTHDDIVRLERAGARAFLVGESLMREPDVGNALRKLRRNS